MSFLNIQIIRSGGQTGVDMAAADFAKKNQIPYTGWCPKGRRWEISDNGGEPIPLEYELKETPTAEYEQRTEWNARDADGTLILIKTPPMGGTLYTIDKAKEHNKPFLIIDLTLAREETISAFLCWIDENNIKELNIAGPRASQSDKIYQDSFQFLSEALEYSIKNQKKENHTNEQSDAKRNSFSF